MARHIFLSILLATSVTTSVAQQDTTWLRRWAGSGTTYQEDWARDIAVDTSGNVYVTGICNAGGEGGSYVTLKYSPGGTLRWERLYRGATYNEAHAIAVDSAGNVWVTGESGSSATRDVYTVAYDTGGNVVWEGRFDFGGGTDVAYDIDAWGAGYAAVTGYGSNGGAPVLFHGVIGWSRQVRGMSGRAIEVLGPSVTVAGADSGMFGVVRYDLQGNLMWHVRSGSAITGYITDVAGLVVDSAGNSYATGTIGDLYTVSFDANGGGRWSAQYSGPRFDGGAAIALDSKCNVITAGSTNQSTEGFEFRGVVMKHDSSGNALWTRVLDFGGVNEHLYTMAVGRGDTIYVAGDRYASGYIDADYLIAKLSPEGDVVWSTTYAGNGTSYSTASAMATDSRGGLYVTGWSSQNNEWPDNADIVTMKFWGKKLFVPDRDGWQFANDAVSMWPQSWWSQFDYKKDPYPFFLTWPPTNATPADFPDWPLFVDVYGVDQCYKKADGGGHYFVPRALLKWRSMVGGNKERDKTGTITSHWRGSCAGFAISSLLYYNNLLSLQWTLGGYDNVYGVPLSDNSRFLVNKYYITYLATFESGSFLTGPETLNSLRTMLVENCTNDQFVSFQDAVTGAGHGVVACSLAAIGSGWWELPIYDPNYPGTYMHLNYSEITEEWSAEEQGWNDILIWLTPIRSTSQPPILAVATTAAASPGESSNGPIEVFNSPYAEIRIRNAAGQTIGFANGARIDSLPGAQPRIDFDNDGHPPVGYFLPSGDYTASIGSSLDSTTYFAMFLDSAAFSFQREGATGGDNEILRFSTAGRSLSVTNPDQTSKAFFLQGIEAVSGEETVCRLHVPAMPAGDSLGIALAGGRNVALFLGGSGMTADLRLELAKDFANPVFEHAGLALEGGASYLVAPTWDSLAAVPLRIYIDRNRDGTADDTLALENEPTAVPEWGQGRIPDHFELEQNYPNPFNSTTVIRYRLPVASTVRLVVYDMLGREVAVLVDETRGAGVHDVRFDADRLASGVYLYRLQVRPLDSAIGRDSKSGAGSFVQTKRLLLLN